MKLVLVCAAMQVVSCGRVLPVEDVNNIENAARSSAMAYKYMDADSNGAQLICATHRSVQAIIRDQKLDAYDSGIPCQ